jgi:hypothetical protein
VAGAPQAAINEATLTSTVINRTNFLLFVDIFIFSWILIRVVVFSTEW